MNTTHEPAARRERTAPSPDPFRRRRAYGEQAGGGELEGLRKSAVVGALVWVGLVSAPLDPNLGLGVIEKLFLLAPLVIVPLGLALAGARRWLGVAQPVGATLVLTAFFVDRGLLAAALVTPWLLLTLAVSADGAVRFWHGAFRQPAELCVAMALLLLPVGGIGLAQSRLGVSPLGYREPVVLLVAVHFHFAAFVGPLMAGLAGRRLDDHPPALRRWYWLVAGAVSLGSPVLAAGYVLFVPLLRVVGAGLLTVGLLALSLLMLALVRDLRPRLAQVLLAVSATTVIAAMLYATVYAVADWFGQVWIAIPHMARTHGVINALGFSLCGLVGWSLVRKET